MELHVDATEAFELAGRYAGAAAIVKSEMHTAMVQSVAVVEAQGKVNAPVKTGTLRRGIVGQAQSHQLGIVHNSNVPYAIFVHEGTRYMAARPYLRRAVQQKRGQILGIWKAMIPRIVAQLRG
jgi:HK97 gp10 family phage protein